jgi:uncharacterized SAM-binding protein YcdF (DUF218 family)
MLLTFFLLGSGIITQPVLSSLQRPSKIEPNWGTSNLIIVLGSGTTRIPGSKELTTSFAGLSRTFKAARLYFDCKASQRICQILASGGDPQRNGMSEAAVIAKELKDLNIPNNDIIIEDRSNNTFLNARFSAELLNKEEDFANTFLVTSGTHLRRALLYFDHFGIQATGISSDYLRADFSILPISSNIYLLDMALHEYIGILRYHLYNLMKWNEPKVVNE